MVVPGPPPPSQTSGPTTSWTLLTVLVIGPAMAIDEPTFYYDPNEVLVSHIVFFRHLRHLPSPDQNVTLVSRLAVLFTVMTTVFWGWVLLKAREGYQFVQNSISRLANIKIIKNS